MKEGNAIFLSGALIAIVILFASRWEMTAFAVPGSTPLALRLDKWTGAISACNANKADFFLAEKSSTGIEYNCKKITAPQRDRLLGKGSTNPLPTSDELFGKESKIAPDLDSGSQSK